MKSHRLALAAVTLAVGWWAVGLSGQGQQAQSPLVLEPLGLSGEAIFPAFEGWGELKDGTTVLLLGYYNRNKNQELDIPVGPDNRIEPGGPDYGQPTHFYTDRQWGLFTIEVPKDFGTRKLTWTLTANGQTSASTFWLNPQYKLSFYKNLASGNEPPIIKFAPDGPTFTGPPHGFAQTLSATVNQPLPLTLWASDQGETVEDWERAALDLIRSRPPAPARAGNDPVAIIGGRVIGSGGRRGASSGGAIPDITVSWKKHRGGGDVRFAHDQIPLVTHGDPKVFLEAKTSATFNAPGEYVIRGQVGDISSPDGGNGEQCCWTTALVRVNVK
jgi:hypothetical protein